MAQAHYGVLVPQPLLEMTQMFLLQSLKQEKILTPFATQDINFTYAKTKKNGKEYRQPMSIMKENLVLL